MLVLLRISMYSANIYDLDAAFASYARGERYTYLVHDFDMATIQFLNYTAQRCLAAPVPPGMTRLDVCRALVNGLYTTWVASWSKYGVSFSSDPPVVVVYPGTPPRVEITLSNVRFSWRGYRHSVPWLRGGFP